VVWQFDIRTALILGAVLTLLTGLMMLAVLPNIAFTQRQSMRWWLYGLFVFPVGPLLIGLRGQIPDFLSIVVGNTAVAIGFAFFVSAYRHFMRQKIYLYWHATCITLVLFFTVVFYYVWDTLNGRLISISLLLALQNSLAASVLLRPKRRISLITGIAGSVFLIGALLLGVRALVYLLSPMENSTDVLVSQPYQVLTYGIAGVAPVVATIGFLLMCAERTQHELSLVAKMDYLTGIHNRRAIDDLASSAIALARRHHSTLSVLVIDVDFFKNINDQHGHAAGDAALVEISRRIRQTLRTEDIFGRIGGEEFVVILPNSNSGQAYAAAERVRLSFTQKPIDLGDLPLSVTVSVGVAELHEIDKSFSDLLRRADSALYSAKSSGRNRAVLNQRSPAK
jgi:diguanylate cyclase (GGDEF)-like protein